MRTKDKIESIIKKFRVTAGAKIYRQTLADVLAAQKSSRKTISAETRPNIRKIARKNKISKFAAAAVIILGMIAGIYFMGGSPDGARPAMAVTIQDVINAMSNTEWVCRTMRIIDCTLEVESNQVEDFTAIDNAKMWTSVSPFCNVNVFTGGMIDFNEEGQGRDSTYDPAANTITIHYQDSFLTERRFSGIDDYLLKEIFYSEEAKNIIYEDGVLDARPVTIIHINQKTGRYQTHAQYFVDPDTLLPIKAIARMVKPQTGKYLVLETLFDYPPIGPSDIYLAGAPRDAEIISPPENYLEVKKRYDAVRDNLPQPRIEVCIREAGNFLYSHVIYINGPLQRYERRLWPLEKKSEFPWGEDFQTIYNWTRFQDSDHVFIDIYDGEYTYTSEYDAKKSESGYIKKWEKYPSFDTYGIRWTGWPNLFFSRHSSIVEDEYALENNYICVQMGKDKYYLDPYRDYMRVRVESIFDYLPPVDADLRSIELLYNEPDRLVEITEFGQFDNGRWYPKKCERTSWRMNKDGQIVNKHYETFTAYVTNNPVFADDTFNPESIAAHVLAYRPIKEKNDRLNRQKSIDKYKQSPEYQQELNKALSCSFEEAISIIDNNESGVEPKELVEAYLFDRTNKLYHRMAILWPGSGAWINQIAEEVPVDYVVGEPIETAEGLIAVPYASKEYFEEHGRYNQEIKLSNEKSAKGRYYIISDK